MIKSHKVLAKLGVGETFKKQAKESFPEYEYLKWVFLNCDCLSNQINLLLLSSKMNSSKAILATAIALLFASGKF